jgi:histidinol-phosphatase
VLDPIDGTMNYMRGIPVWGTLIALVHDGRPVVGVVSAPALHRRWWAAAGTGAWEGERRLSASGIASLVDAQVSFNEPAAFVSRGWGDAIDALADGAWRVRGFGDFWQHMLVAEGAVDVALEAVINPWDMAACQIIVEEAGGRYTDLTGVPDYSTGSSLSTNGLLHDEVLALFNG